MYRTHIYITLSTDLPMMMNRKWAYLITIEGHDKTASATVNTEATRHAATLEALADALARFKQPAQITVHAQDVWVLNTMQKTLPKWAESDFRTSRGGEVQNRDLWERVWKKTRYKKMLINTERHPYSEMLLERMKNG